jgi:hypothetical protein
MVNKFVSAGRFIGNFIAGVGEEGITENLVFKRYKRQDIIAALDSTGDSPVEPEVNVTLRVNPEEIRYAKPKITQKVQTSAPGRFVIFDWGTDLMLITIQGNTGILIPDMIVNSSGPDPVSRIANSVAKSFDLDPRSFNTGFNDFMSGSKKIGAFIGQQMMQKLPYSELVQMSPNYRSFVRLQGVYDTFDADYHVLTLEYGENVYRGFFSDFSFAINAANPWNYKYSISFVVIHDITALETRQQDEFTQSTFVATAR